MATKTTTATQILAGVYTVAMCADAADARIAMRQIIERMPVTAAFAEYPAVYRRYMGLRKLVLKFEGAGATMYAPEVEAGAAPTAEQATAAGRTTTPTDFKHLATAPRQTKHVGTQQARENEAAFLAADEAPKCGGCFGSGVGPRHGADCKKCDGTGKPLTELPVGTQVECALSGGTYTKGENNTWQPTAEHAALGWQPFALTDAHVFMSARNGKPLFTLAGKPTAAVRELAAKLAAGEPAALQAAAAPGAHTPATFDAAQQQAAARIASTTDAGPLVARMSEAVRNLARTTAQLCTPAVAALGRAVTEASARYEAAVATGVKLGYSQGAAEYHARFGNLYGYTPTSTRSARKAERERIRHAYWAARNEAAVARELPALPAEYTVVAGAAVLQQMVKMGTFGPRAAAGAMLAQVTERQQTPNYVGGQWVGANIPRVRRARMVLAKFWRELADMPRVLAAGMFSQREEPTAAQIDWFVERVRREYAAQCKTPEVLRAMATRVAYWLMRNYQLGWAAEVAVVMHPDATEESVRITLFSEMHADDKPSPRQYATAAFHPGSGYASINGQRFLCRHVEGQLYDLLVFENGNTLECRAGELADISGEAGTLAPLREGPFACDKIPAQNGPYTVAQNQYEANH